MVNKKPRIVIIGAGMAGLTAANKLCKSPYSKHLFELSIVEGGNRIGGRINSSEFCGDRIEQGATWIHGIEGSPVYEIAQESNLLHSDKPWECMDGIPEDPVTVGEGGHVLNPSFVEPISRLFENLMFFIQGKAIDEDGVTSQVVKRLSSDCGLGNGSRSVGSFLRQGLEVYWEILKDKKEVKGVENWTRKKLEEAIFAMHESVQRTFTSADDLGTLDYDAEKEYIMFPGDEITIAGGYSRVIESLASVLPVGMIQLGRKVERIEWQPEGYGHRSRPVKLHFSDGSTMRANHVIVTVSLGVLKRGTRQDCRLFDPPLPCFKTEAISRLGYGVVNKVFLQLSSHDQEANHLEFPFVQTVLHRPDSELRNPKVPQWMRRTSSIHPIYRSSRVVRSWFTGQEALELESLSEEEIIKGFSATVSDLLSSRSRSQTKQNSHKLCNGTENSGEMFPDGTQLKFAKVLRTQWGTNPLFLGSYSYVAVGSSGDDMDWLAEPLPQYGDLHSTPQLQILFAGEATHRTHYSTTHGAYFSGLREANRLLKHYNCTGV